MIIDHTHPIYRAAWTESRQKWNGAYYYSIEIVKYFIPAIKTDRSWVTVNVPGIGADHAIVFIHNNKMAPKVYDWLRRYDDLILVCGVPETCEKVKEYGTPIYLPLSVNVDEVIRYKCEKDRDTAFAGRRVKRAGVPLEGIDFLENIPREELLSEMAHYQKVYAVGRTAIEARVLGCEILPYDNRYPDPSIWEVVDTKDAIKLLQRELDKHDRHSW